MELYSVQFKLLALTLHNMNFPYFGALPLPLFSKPCQLKQKQTLLVDSIAANFSKIVIQPLYYHEKLNFIHSEPGCPSTEDEGTKKSYVRDGKSLANIFFNLSDNVKLTCKGNKGCKGQLCKSLTNHSSSRWQRVW